MIDPGLGKDKCMNKENKRPPISGINSQLLRPRSDVPPLGGSEVVASAKRHCQSMGDKNICIQDDRCEVVIVSDDDGDEL